MILRLLTSAPWRRAPLLLLRRPALLAAVAAVGAAVGLAGAAGPLFLSSVGSAMVAEDLSEGCPATVGLRVVAGGFLGEIQPDGTPATAGREAALEAAVLEAGVDGGVELTAVGPVVDAGTATGDGRALVRLVHRERIAERVDAIAVAPDVEGAWVPETAAGLIGVGAGEELTLRPPGRPPVSVPVGGVYRDIALPLAAAWCAHGRLAYPAGFLETPQSLLLVDRDTFAELEPALGPAHSTLVWEAAVPARGLDLPTASRLAGRLDRLARELRSEATELHLAVGAQQAATRLPDFVEVWEATAASVRSGVLPVAAAVVVVCLLFVASVARSWCEQRHAELALLVARGAPPGALGVKAALETVAALAVGAVTGAVVAMVGVRTLGPSSLLDDEGLRLAVSSTGAAVLAAVGVVVTVVVTRTRRLEDPAVAHRRVGGAVVAEVVVAGAAALAWWRITSADDDLLRQPTGAPRVDALHVAFPLLAIAAVAALVVRLLVRLLPRLRRTPTSAPLPVYLASRRLAAAGSSLHVLAVAATVAAGLFTCSAVVVSSIGTTLDAKAARFVGGDTAVRVASVVEELPPSLAGRATSVGRWLRAEDPAGGGDLQVIGIDRATFGDGAFWHRSLADVSLEELFDLLADRSGGDVVPVAVAGLGGGRRLPTAVAFGSGASAVEVPVEVVALLDAFPGQRGVDPLLVADLDRMAALRPPSMGEVWGDVDAGSMVRALQAAGATVWGDVTADEVLGVGSFRTTAWTFGFLRAVASMIGVLTIAGLLAHLAGRERRVRLGYAIARRFGLRSTTSVAAYVVELAPLVALAAAVGGAAGLIAAAAVHGRLDALARLAPAPLLSVPIATLVLALAVAVVALVAGCAGVQRTADRADVTEVLRAEG